MKNNFKILIVALVALSVGLGVGYVLFGNGSKNTSTTAADHNGKEHSPDSDSDQIWTCSMHPQIKQNEPGDCPLCGMDLIPLSQSSSDDPLVLEMTPEAVKLANIQTTTIGATSGSTSNKTIRLTGKVKADERLASSQVAHVPGRIEKLFVSFTGERVNKGQKIATLYSPELITAQRELLEALKLQNLNPGLLEAARNKLRYWKIGDATIESIEQKGIIQETFTVYADGSGIVTNRRVSVGDYVKQGEPIFDLMNLQKVWVLFDAYEEDLSTIKVGSSIEFSTPSIPEKTFKTKVTFIDPVINPETRVASIRTEIRNPGGLLKPEMLVYGSLQNKTGLTQQLSVPKSAVLWTGQRSVAYVKVPDRTVPSFQFREIKIGEARGDSYQVLEGLEAGEEVVTYGNFTIDAAAQLNNQASMMNRNVKVKNNNSVLVLPDYTASTPADFKRQLSKTAAAYLSLKDALVATNSKEAVVASRALDSLLSRIDAQEIKTDAQEYWMQQSDIIREHNLKITSSENIDEQRRQFDFLSQGLINVIKVFGVSEDTLYVQHCPMANNNQGADWLSGEAQIQNPYFGDKMMTCGVVKTVIDNTFKNPSVITDSNSRQNIHNH